MQTEDQLLKLIRSLSKSEKTYFIKNLKINDKSKPKKYITLFKQIDNFKGDSIDKLKESISDAEIQLYFNQYKKYLFDAILQTLQVFWRSESTVLEISGLVSEALILEQKMLLKSAMRYAKKALDLSRKSNDVSFSLVAQQIIYRCKIRMMSNLSLDSANEYLNFWDEFAELEYEMKTARHIAFLNNCILAALNNRHMHGTDSYTTFIQNIANRADKYKIDWNPPSKQGKIFAQLGSMYLNELENLPKQLQRSINQADLNNAVNLIDDQYIQYNLNGAVVELFNIGIYATENNNSSLAFNCAERLLAIQSRSENIQDRVTSRGLVLFLMASLLENDKIPEALKVISAYKEYIDNRFTLNKNQEFYFPLFLSLSYVHYRAGNYKEALRYNNELCFGEQVINSGIRFKSLILNLLINYHRGNDSYDYIIKQISKHTSQNKWDTSFIDALINLLKLLAVSSSGGAINSACDKLIDIITKSSMNSEKGNAVGALSRDLDILNWVISFKK